MLAYLSKVSYVLKIKRSNLVFLAFLFIFNSLLDALGIGIVGPFIGLAASPNWIYQNSFLNWLYSQLGMKTSGQFITLIGLVVIIIFYVKSFLYFWLQQYVYKFAYSRQGKLRLRLMHSYLAAPYTFHLNTNTALLIQSVINEAQDFCLGILIPLLFSAANLVVLCALVLLLAITSLPATLSILGIFLI